MKRPPSLRSRVAVGIVALAVLMVGVHSIVVYVASHQLEEELIDQLTADELEHFIIRYRQDPGLTPPQSQTVKGYIVADAVARSRLPSYLSDLPAGQSEAFADGKELHVAVRDEPEGRFIMTYQVGHIEARERRFVQLLYAGFIVTIVLAGALGYRAAAALVRPLGELAWRVERLDANPPRVPLVQSYRDEEVRRLAQAFDGYLAKVAQLVEREREFTENVSHELRTPVTTMRTSCELLLQEPGLSPEARRRIEAIDRAAARLSDNIHSLLYLARGGEALRLEQVSVHECVAEAAETVIDVLGRKDIAFENAVDATAIIRADRNAMSIVLENLLRNAASYTEHGLVQVSYRDGCLVIEDSGPGIHASELPRIAERYYRGARTKNPDGIGLGLAIVKRICERFDWRFEISSTSGTGTRVAVFFPIAPLHHSG